MKRRIAFILMLVMLASCMFGLSAVAEALDGGETPPPADETVVSYKDVDIEYVNVAYSNKLSVQFAVPAPTDLPEGVKVQLLLWVSPDAAKTSFNYEGAVANIDPLEADEATVEIGGKQYLVFKYEDLSLHMMTDTFYARTYVEAEGKKYYGDVVDYSIVEYVKTAKGEFDSFAGIESQETKDLLDALLVFGGTIQKTAKEDGYLPNGYYANDTLGKIWIIPVIDGVEKDAIFGGFFKAGEDGYANLAVPVKDGFNTGASWKDAEGNALVDADENVDTGFQVATPAEGDLTVKCVYERDYMYVSALNDADTSATNVMADSSINGNAKGVNINPGNFRTNTGANNYKKGQWVSYQIIDDPDGSENKVLRISTTGGGALYFGYGQNPIIGGHGMGDTIGNSFTLTMEIAAYNGEFRNMGNMRLRANEGGGVGKYDQNIFNLGADGKIKYNFNGNSEVIHELSLEGWNKIAVSIDFDEMTISFYAEEEGVMVCKDTREFIPAKYNSVAAAGTPDETANTFAKSFMNYQRTVEWYFGSADGLSSEELNSLVDLDGDGTPETSIKVSGTGVKDAGDVPESEAQNVQALQKYIIDNKSILVKEISFVAGDIYAQD